MNKKLPAVIFLFCNILIPFSVYADQDDRYDPQQDVSQEVNQASNAGFDKRLPPVLPGEVLNDGQGKTKVWSTAGSVSSSAPPVPPAAPQVPQDNANLNNNLIGGVIVDDRGFQRGHGRR